MTFLLVFGIAIYLLLGLLTIYGSAHLGGFDTSTGFWLVLLWIAWPVLLPYIATDLGDRSRRKGDR